MRTEHTGPAVPDGPKVRVQLLVESQYRHGPGTNNHFLWAARYLAEVGTPAVVFLIDDGVRSAVDRHAEVAAIVAAGGPVWVDQESLAQRTIRPGELGPGVEAVDLDRVGPLLFDPAVQTVWH